jgi:hypothetical protein
MNLTMQVLKIKFLFLTFIFLFNHVTSRLVTFNKEGRPRDILINKQRDVTENIYKGGIYAIDHNGMVEAVHKLPEEDYFKGRVNHNPQIPRIEQHETLAGYLFTKKPNG